MDEGLLVITMNVWKPNEKESLGNEGGKEGRRKKKPRRMYIAVVPEKVVKKWRYLFGTQVTEL